MDYRFNRILESEFVSEFLKTVCQVPTKTNILSWIWRPVYSLWSKVFEHIQVYTNVCLNTQRSSICLNTQRDMRYLSLFKYVWPPLWLASFRASSSESTLLATWNYWEVWEAQGHSMFIKQQFYFVLGRCSRGFNVVPLWLRLRHLVFMKFTAWQHTTHRSTRAELIISVSFTP